MINLRDFFVYYEPEELNPANVTEILTMSE